MRGYLLLITLAALLLFNPAYGREAGWVPIAKDPYKPPYQPGASPAKKVPASKAAISGSKQAATVYERQPLVTEAELTEFIALLPQFRAWARQNGEEAHPVVNKAGKPDFVYSPRAAEWVKKRGFEASRFFCIMGRMAAGIVIVEEGNDMQNARPRDMPPVDKQEVKLVRRHLGELLTAAGQPAQ